MRPSKNQHVVALLREQIGLSQEKFAESVDVKRRTIQDVELCVRPISVAIADKISRKWGVSISCLRQNDLKHGLRDLNGNPWTTASMPGHQRKSSARNSWDTLSEATLHYRIRSTQMLVSQFQDLRDFFDHGVCDKQEALLQWHFLFRLCFLALDKLQTDGTYSRRDHGDAVESTLGDLHALDKALRTWTKRSKKLEIQMDAKATEAYRNLYCDRYGWDTRGTEAYELARELGLKEAAQMDQGEFVSKLNQRLMDKGLRPLYREVKMKDCFEAIRAVYDDTGD
jgi:transcriptional regulator with XRE-family HTH domain